MRRLYFTAILAIILMAIPAQFCRAEVTVGATIGDEGVKEFHMAVGKHYNYPENQVVVVRQKNIPEDELPVVFFLARRAQVSPMTVVKLRQGGQSWWDISLHYGLSPDIFFVPVHGDPGPPYGRAYGYYKDKDKHHWKTVRLEDDDIINLVNLRFLSDRYKHSPDDIIRLRAGGGDFVKIHGEVKRGKDHGKDKGKSSSGDQGGSKDKDKDKGKDHKK
ncbi:MAG: hypothetical protein PHR28_03750 [candidate division Zixibacteria bacterium]|nr:hypothetical protein [candidate division Zixibacteria bacterium]